MIIWIWGQHISEISSKATKTLGFLRRNLAFAPKSTKEVAYKTLVRPKLEYAAPIWSSYSKFQINQVEKVQRTAARWTCKRWRNTSSVGQISDSFTILGLWVLGLPVSNINESQLHTYESKTLFLMKSLQYYCIPGLARTR